MPAADDPSAHSQPVTPLQLFEGRRSRRRREAPKVAEEQESRVQYTVCIWWALPASCIWQWGGGAWGQGRAQCAVQAEPVQPAPPPCRRNGKVGLSGMAIADITLLSGFHALRADLEKVRSGPHSPPLSPGALLHLCSTPGAEPRHCPLPCS